MYMAKLIVLDAGHGEDTYERTGGKGVRHGGKVYEEHHFNADVIKHAKKQLRQHGFDVWFTQSPNEREIPLIERTNEANRLGADLFVSVHANAGGGSGACSFAWHTSDDAKKFARQWVGNFSALVNGVELHGDGLHESRPKSWTNMHVCRETAMTAVLLEHGFMDDYDNDFEYIFGNHTAKYRKQCAEAIAKTVCDYYGVKYRAEKDESKPKATKDTQKYRLMTGTWDTAEGLVGGKERLRENGYGWLIYEVAEDGPVEPEYRILTGTFTGKANAEKIAQEIRNKFGWTMYVVEA
jgi:N-acetylmuramoyl-L-alanine amidase